MDTLVALGSLASFIYSIGVTVIMITSTDKANHLLHELYFESAAMILTLISLGKYLENRAKGKTGDAIRQLLDLAPKTATVRINGEEKIVSVDQIQVGDIVTLKKQHPCGSKEWEILRVGADFRLKCMGCGHQIMIARKLVEKNTKELRKKATT